MSGLNAEVEKIDTKFTTEKQILQNALKEIATADNPEIANALTGGLNSMIRVIEHKICQGHCCIISRNEKDIAMFYMRLCTLFFNSHHVVDCQACDNFTIRREDYLCYEQDDRQQENLSQSLLVLDLLNFSTNIAHFSTTLQNRLQVYNELETQRKVEVERVAAIKAANKKEAKLAMEAMKEMYFRDEINLIHTISFMK